MLLCEQQLQVPMRSGLIALVEVQFGRINDVAGHFPVKFRLCCQVDKFVRP